MTGTEYRTHNQQNEIISVGGQSLGYDANGNLTLDQAGQALTYDAWNRLVRVDQSGEIFGQYEYDALGRRIEETDRSDIRDLYYSGWQVIEERVNGVTETRYVRGPGYIDSFVLRDRDTNGDGTLDERLYVQQDANFNVTALVDVNGNVVERCAYDPFGVRSVYDASWSAVSGSAVAWVYGHQGLRHNLVVGLIENRMRVYDPELGRFLQMDPPGFGAGDVNWYRAIGNGPTNGRDPSGLADIDSELDPETAAAIKKFKQNRLQELNRDLGVEIVKPVQMRRKTASDIELGVEFIKPSQVRAREIGEQISLAFVIATLKFANIGVDLVCDVALAPWRTLELATDIVHASDPWYTPINRNAKAYFSGEADLFSVVLLSTLDASTIVCGFTRIGRCGATKGAPSNSTASIAPKLSTAEVDAIKQSLKAETEIVRGFEKQFVWFEKSPQSQMVAFHDPKTGVIHVGRYQVAESIQGHKLSDVFFAEVLANARSGGRIVTEIRGIPGSSNAQAPTNPVTGTLEGILIIFYPSNFSLLALVNR